MEKNHTLRKAKMTQVPQRLEARGCQALPGLHPRQRAPRQAAGHLLTKVNSNSNAGPMCSSGKVLCRGPGETLGPCVLHGSLPTPTGLPAPAMFSSTTTTSHTGFSLLQATVPRAHSPAQLSTPHTPPTHVMISGMVSTSAYN